MLKQILNIEGVHQISRKHLRAIGGGVNKCCIRIPTHGVTNEISDTEEHDRICPDPCKKYKCCGGTTPNGSY